MQCAAWEQRAGAVLRRLEGIENPVVAEIGVGTGRMSRELLKRADLRLHMVDSFLPMTQQPTAYVATRDNFALRDGNKVAEHRAAVMDVVHRYPKRAVLHETDSEMASHAFGDGGLHLVFVDADHSYEGVKRDIACWLPKVKTGGWLGGHDYANPDARFDFSGVKRAVDEFSHNFSKVVEFDSNFTWFVRL